nr:hypothetical protein [Tanacetum cinerariifolium]
MGLLSYIRHSDPTNVRVRERNVAEGEVKLMTLTEGRVVSLVPPTLVAIGGSNDSIDKLFDDGDDAGQEHPSRKDFDPDRFSVPSEVAEPRDDGPMDSVSGLNLWNHHPSMRSPVADARVMTVAVTTIIVTDISVVLVSKDRVKSGNLENFKDSESAGGANANVAEKDDEIAHLKTLLSMREAEAAEAIRLRGQLSVLSRNELSSKEASLEFERDSLTDQKSSLESSFEHFKERMKAMQDDCVINKGMQDGLKAGVDHGKDGRDLSMIEAYDPSTEAKYIDAVNTLRTVDFPFLSILKSKKDECMADLMDSFRLEGLAEIPGAKELLPSLEQLMLPIHRPKDDVVIEETSLSFSLQIIHSRVERVKGEIMGKRLSLTDVMIPFVEPLSSKSLIGKASTSAISATVGPITTLSKTFASFCIVPTLSVYDYQVLDTEPHDEDPPAVTFEEEELDTTLE